MSAQLRQSHRPVAAAQPQRLVHPALAPPRPSRPAAAGETVFSGSHAERDVGLGLLFRFLIASFLVVGVVVLVSAVGQDWILAPALAIHLALTYAVLHGIFLLVKDGYESDGPGGQHA